MVRRQFGTKGSSVHSGILLVDKPHSLTSHDVVARTRKLAGTRRVGHAGTLDPMATGLLILGVNSSTRLLTYVVGQDKEYLATIRLGLTTSTDDAEGEALIQAEADAVRNVSEAALVAAVANLTGDISQVPSSVSAIKVDGKRAYALVRAGETVELKSRPVTVARFDVLERRQVDGFLDLDVRVECSSGTYIRALARDLGAALGIGGHLTRLRRTRIGPFSVDAASTLDALDVATELIGPADAASALFPTLSLTEQQAIDLGHGKKVPAGDLSVSGALGDDGLVAGVAPDGRLVGLVKIAGDIAKSAVNFPADGQDS
ncbi:tRNA pseudouridine55 synthase [Okibacterium sp. HSC-33S16]|uniref:tRNA pseudouridine(55) synthase TruB n=1 Tax=Okibacterium sp. HSC-33S16 TaxID=2910965 RepID=UPI0020A0EB1A|nr:tRNA pseudouridine(55) synthase TruB [Okibacterium sp. HSC-33S16]MCP2031857.1 tRNA pseudouridine55 synthase [Okibacterium sp. HSC-33S16]